MVHHFEAADLAHLLLDGNQKLFHSATRVAAFTRGMREQLYGGDIGIGIGDAAGHHGPRICLRLRSTRQARHEVTDTKCVQHQPAEEWHQQPSAERASHEDDGDEVDQHVNQNVGDREPGVAHS